MDGAVEESIVDFYSVMIDSGKRKRFAVGFLAESYESELKLCPACGVKWSMPGHDRWFNDKAWNMKMLMSREHYADFTWSDASCVVSEKAQKILMENFNNAVDFGEIEMVSLRDLTESFLKKERRQSGSKAAKMIANDPPQYYRLFLKIGADLDFEKTNIELALDCPECGRKSYVTPGEIIIFGATPHIIESTWQGYDIFYVEGLGTTMFCTERFVEVYNQNKLTGFLFEQVPAV